MTAHSLEEMVQQQILARGIRDERVLAAMRTIDRRDFVPATSREQAYRDGPLPLMAGQTISQPYVVAWMTELLQVAPDHHVLEIGSGSGYQTAILACLSRHVVSIEKLPELHELATANLDRYRFPHITLICKDGRLGHPEAAPYDRILLTAAPRSIPEPLLDQLRADGGILVAPVGGPFGQELIRLTRHGDHWSEERLGGVIFVPLT